MTSFIIQQRYSFASIKIFNLDHLEDLSEVEAMPRWGVLPNSQYKGAHANIWGVNQYMRSVNCDMDKNSIFGIHKSEEMKNRGIWCDSLATHPMTKSCLLNK